MPEDSQKQRPQPRAFTEGDVTILLRKLSHGDIAAISHLMSAVYNDLKRIAANRLRHERPDHTLEPAALVNEFFLRLAKKPGMQWKNRQEFLAMASHEMRLLLVDYARSHNARKRGGGASKVEWNDSYSPLESSTEELLEIHDLLDRLESEEPRMAKVVEMRCFGGLTHQEIGAVLGIDERTAKRDWNVAKAWLESSLRKKRDVSRPMGIGKNRV